MKRRVKKRKKRERKRKKPKSRIYRDNSHYTATSNNFLTTPNKLQFQQQICSFYRNTYRLELTESASPLTTGMTYTA
jgi:hypothetical protein